MKPSANAVSMNAPGNVSGNAAAFDDTFQSGRIEALIRTLAVATGLIIALAVIVILGGRARLHWPNVGLLAAQPLVIQLHVTAAITALTIGAGLMWGPKGTTIHRAFGWTWAVAMMTVAISSFFIHPGGFSPIHALSAYVAIGVPMGVAFARRHNIRAHRRMMTGTFLGGLIVAGAFTFVPGRLMWRVFFG